MSSTSVDLENIKPSFTQKKVLQFLTHLQVGAIHFKDQHYEKTYGDPNHPLKASIEILDQRFYSQVIWQGSIGFAEGYMEKTWVTNDLTKLLRILTLNIHIVDKADQSWLGALVRQLQKFNFWLQRNNKTGAKANIAKHYDLGNDFFKLFLDHTMMYSAAKFEKPDETLQQASINKLKMICEKLELKSNDHVLEIGSGWGGFACYAAKYHGCKVTTTTISQAQFDYTQQRVKDKGLEPLVTVIKQDYRDLKGQYDKLVSIEMIEAVGPQYYKHYFQQCSQLLKPEGLFLLQSIVIGDQRYKLYKKTVDFIKQYIFPGGSLPSLEVIMRHMRAHTDLNVLHIDDITLDYARTLRAWCRNFIESKAQIMEAGFDEMFMRMWIYYFCYCEAGFLERYIADYQILFAKPGYRHDAYSIYENQ